MIYRAKPLRWLWIDWGQNDRSSELELNPQIITRFASYSYLLDLDNASVAQHLEQEIHVVADLGNRVAQLSDLAARVQHGRMVAAAEVATNLRQR